MKTSLPGTTRGVLKMGERGREQTAGWKERRIELADAWDNERAVIETRAFAARAGFNETDQALISTAASELSTNILRYAGKGEIRLKTLARGERTGIELCAVDEGPGIKDVEQAMRENFTTTKGSLGLGLSSVRRIMDEFEIESVPGRGTRIRACKWRPDGER